MKLLNSHNAVHFLKTLLQDGNLEVKKVGGITVTKKVEIIKLTDN